MKFYATKDGYLVQWGNTQDDQLPVIEDCEVFAGEPPQGLQFPPKPAPTYAEERFKAYPYLGDQLDMLWHGMDDGILPKVEPFYTAIKNVKEQYPKP